jgi:hypothetical protein
MCVPFTPLVHLSRVGAFMLTALARLTLKWKGKTCSVLLDWFHGAPYIGTQQKRSDIMHR